MLDRILDNKRRELDALAPVDGTAVLPSTRDFHAALRAQGLSIIAEVKRRSPSAGAIDESVDPVKQALQYESGGARAISVLTDKTFFGGSMDDLEAVRNGVEVPVLCKDFVLDRRQVIHARRAGADAVLLIVAALDDRELRALIAETQSYAMDALVEVHNEEELERALQTDAEIIGINNRDLKTMEVHLGTASRLAMTVPPERVVVAESGYESADQLGALPQRVDAVLIGGALMRSRDPAAMLRSWLEGESKGGTREVPP